MSRRCMSTMPSARTVAGTLSSHAASACGAGNLDLRTIDKDVAHEPQLQMSQEEPTVPTDEAIRREREVVQLVIACLRSASHVEVEWLGSPDEQRDSRRFPPDLTVEALLLLSNEDTECTWAVDVMNLSWDPRLVPAISGFEDGLRTELQQLALEMGVGLSVLYKPPVAHKDRGAGYRRQIVDYARRLIEGEEHDPHESMHPLAADASTGVDVDREPTEPGRVMIAAGLAQTPDIAAQLDATLVPPLEKKLSRQLLRAHELGYPTLLAIDQVGPQSEVGNNFIASAAAIGQVVSRTVARHGHAGGQHSLDAAVLVTGTGCAPVYASWPNGPRP